MLPATSVQVWQIELVDQWLPASFYLVENGLLYYRREHCGQVCDLLVIPLSKTQLLTHLAHAHPLGGHVGPQNTLRKVEKKGFPQRPLTIISVPFKWIGMELVGPLPKSTRGQKYILVILDYTTRYPKAVPLWKATSQNITSELVLLLSGSPRTC